MLRGLLTPPRCLLQSPLMARWEAGSNTALIRAERKSKEIRAKRGNGPAHPGRAYQGASSRKPPSPILSCLWHTQTSLGINLSILLKVGVANAYKSLPALLLTMWEQVCSLHVVWLKHWTSLIWNCQCVPGDGEIMFQIRTPLYKLTSGHWFWTFKV